MSHNPALMEGRQGVLVKIGAVCLASFFFIGIVSSLFSGESETTASGDAPTEQIAPPAAQETTATPPPTTAKPKPKPVPTPATGRLDAGDYERIVEMRNTFASEGAEFYNGVSTCSNVGLAGDLQAWKECIEEAHDNAYSSAFSLYVALDGLKDDAGGKCRTALIAFQGDVDRVGTVGQEIVDAAKVYDIEGAAAYSELAAPMIDQLQKRSTAFDKTCSPR